jgi:hypothetical protein
LDERSELHRRAPCLLDRRVDRLDQPVVEGKRAKAAKDIDPGAEQLRVVGREVCALEGEIAGLRKPITAGDPQLKEDLLSIEEKAAVAGNGGRTKRRRVNRGAARGCRRLVLAATEVRRADEQRVGVLEQDSRRPSEANEALKQDVWAAVGEAPSKFSRPVCAEANVLPLIVQRALFP